MVRYSTLTLAGLATYMACAAAANTAVFFDAPNILAIREEKTCERTQARCDDRCIMNTSTCCERGNGEACPQGYTCYSQGGCPEGKECTVEPDACGDGRKMCRQLCIDATDVCCGREICPPGRICRYDGQCEFSNP